VLSITVLLFIPIITAIGMRKKCTIEDVLSYVLVSIVLIVFTFLALILGLII